MGGVETFRRKPTFGDFEMYMNGREEIIEEGENQKCGEMEMHTGCFEEMKEKNEKKSQKKRKREKKLTDRQNCLEMLSHLKKEENK